MCFALLCLSSCWGVFAEVTKWSRSSCSSRAKAHVLGVWGLCANLSSCAGVGVWTCCLCACFNSLDFSRDTNDSLLDPFTPPKLLLILPTTYPCHVLLDSSSSSPMNCVCVSVWLACAHIKLVELSYVTGYSILDVCKLLTSILYMSLLCSPIPPTEFVLPPSAQWSMSCTLCSRDRTEGKRPLACSPSDSQKQPSWPTKTQHEATKWQPVQPLLL